MGKMLLPCCCYTLLHMPLLEEGDVIIRNWKIFVGYGLSDILKVPTRYDVIEAYEVEFLGCNGIIRKYFPGIVANVARYFYMTTNHAEVLTKEHW